jgi:glutamine synthetase adenylyltransferase
MEALRHFKLAHRLRVAASEIAGSLPLMKVSDYLTWLAEAILEQVLALAWRQTVARHGTPQRTTAACAILASSLSVMESRRPGTGAWFGPGPGVHP